MDYREQRWNQEAIGEALAVILVTDDGGRRAGREMADFGCILKRMMTGFVDILELTLCLYEHWPQT